MAKASTISLKKVTRSGEKFTVDWKSGEYTGIKIQTWKKTGSSWPSKPADTESISKSKTAYTRKLDFDDYKPFTDKLLYAVGFAISVQTKGKEYSNYSSKSTFDIQRPKVPTHLLNPAQDSTNPNVFTYGWDNNSGNTTSSGPVCTAFGWETVIMDDGASPVWKEAANQKLEIVKVSDGTPATKGASRGRIKANKPLMVTITESNADISAGKVRWFRVRAEGPQGVSNEGGTNKDGWAVRSHKLGGESVEPPDPDTETSVEESNGQGTPFSLKLSGYKMYAGDTLKLQYTVTAPYVYAYEEGEWMKSDLRFPNGYDGWTTFRNWFDTNKPDVLSDVIPAFVGVNQCLFMRINYVHDNQTHYGMPFLLNQKTNLTSTYDDVPASISTSTGSNGEIIGTVTGSWPTQITLGSNEISNTKNTVVGKLSSPTLNSTQIDPDTKLVTINVTNNAQLADGGNNSFIAVYCQTASNTNPLNPIAIIPYSESGRDYSFLGDWGDGEDPTFKIQCYVADYTPKTKSTGLTVYTLNNILMQSGTDSKGESIPKAATNVNASRYAPGIALVTWDWTWAEANAVELSWAEDLTAWESTSEPSSFTISGTRIGKRYINDLNATTYWIKIRFLRTVGDSVVYGSYSDPVKVVMSSAPSIPTLRLSKTTATPTEKVTATWIYESTDGSGQESATFYEAIKDETTGTWTYTDLSPYGGYVNRAKSFTFTPSKFGWTNNTTHYISVQPKSESGLKSTGYSTPVLLNVAPAPSLPSVEAGTITGIGGENDALRPFEVMDPYDPEQSMAFDLALTRLPLTFNILGVGTGGYATVTIERNTSSRVDIPDDSKREEYKGETIVSKVFRTDATSTDPDTITATINVEDCSPKLEHLGQYKMIITVTDTYGQSAVSPDYIFSVYWDHLGEVPTATITLDKEHDYALITPDVPTGFMQGDSCDIYRLSADRPMLIKREATFGETYVDDYPTYGRFGGYRIVYVTKYGDDSTTDNALAWMDYSPIVGNLQAYDKFMVSIEFDDNIVEFPGNIAVSNSWAKDFQTTKYMGGSIVGDWNPGVERTGSINGTIPVGHEEETIYLLRLLADYAGKCHVRTPEGSNFYADVQVQDDREEKWVNKISKISLSFTTVDSRENEIGLYDGE